ncbi:MAG: hypothetical protein IPQ16_02460 [Geobacteraceae bacterium]|nr:hypothetical protein [Geobacteraceae bacterium]
MTTSSVMRRSVAGRDISSMIRRMGSDTVLSVVYVFVQPGLRRLASSAETDVTA